MGIYGKLSLFDIVKPSSNPLKKTAFDQPAMTPVATADFAEGH